MSIRLSAKLAMCAVAIPFLNYAQVAGDYRSIGSGTYATASIWEKYDGTAWNAATSAPGSAANVTVQSGSSISITGTSNSLTLKVESGASIKSDGLGQRGLRIYGGSLINNGIIGGGFGDDSINVEVAGNGLTYTLSGTGSTKVNRLRAYYGLIGTNVVIDQDVTFTNSSSTGGSGVGLSAYYNSATGTIAGEDVTVTINAGRTATFINGAVVHFASLTTANTAGNYTYNINGTADLSASLGTMSFIPNSNNAASVTKMNINGTLKLGYGINTLAAGTGTTPGTIQLNVAAGATVDAIANAKMTMGTDAFIMADGTAVIKRAVAAIDTLFPIAIATGGYNAVTMNNTGTADVYSIKLKNTFDFTSPQPTQLVNRQWTISEGTAGGGNNTIQLRWLVADQAAAFTPASASIYVIDAAGVQTEYPAVVTGTGTLADPYVATASGITQVGYFFVGNPGIAAPGGGSHVSVGSLDQAHTLLVIPNPASGNNINLHVAGLTAGTYNISITNAIGQSIYTQALTHAGSDADYSFQLGNQVAAGSYQLTLAGNHTANSIKVEIR